ncbi:MAG: ATP-binding cassette domain-containing protein [Nitrospirota bacterium]
MIEFRDVVVAYGNHIVLNRLNFRVGAHEKVAILGGSGRGKTTILRLILGLVRPDDGKIFINGQDITALSELHMRDIRQKFSIVFQEGALFDSLSVKENVAYCMREYSDLSEEAIESSVRTVLRRMGLEDTIYLMPEELSGGMQRRVAIARSLASCTPHIMLYDEPTTGLDPIAADNICNIINELSSGPPSERPGLIIVTHRVRDAAIVAERFIYLTDRVAFDGGIEELKATEDPELRHFVNEIICTLESHTS